jgi:hypothetical protein
MRHAQELNQTINSNAILSVTNNLPLIRKANNNTWMDDFLLFRGDFEFAESTKKVIVTFAELRARHEAPAHEAFANARQLFQQGKQNKIYTNIERNRREVLCISPLLQR